MEAFIHSIHHHQPSFLRPAGDFDSWYLQNTDNGEFLRGFEFWDRIEGALIRYILTQPLHFLGAVDLGGVQAQKPALAFRLTDLSEILFGGEVLFEDDEEAEPTRVFPDGRILATPSSSQAHRYQIARFCDWVDLSDLGFAYRVTPTALQRATDQGLTLPQIITILEAANHDKLHPSLTRAITRWAKEGREAYIEQTIVLRVINQETMEILHSEMAVSRYFQEILGPTTVTIKEKDLEKVYSAASRLGILLDIP